MSRNYAVAAYRERPKHRLLTAPPSVMLDARAMLDTLYRLNAELCLEAQEAQARHGIVVAPTPHDLSIPASKCRACAVRRRSNHHLVLAECSNHGLLFRRTLLRYPSVGHTYIAIRKAEWNLLSGVKGSVHTLPSYARPFAKRPLYAYEDMTVPAIVTPGPAEHSHIAYIPAIWHDLALSLPVALARTGVLAPSVGARYRGKLAALGDFARPALNYREILRELLADDEARDAVWLALGLGGSRAAYGILLGLYPQHTRFHRRLGSYAFHNDDKPWNLVEPPYWAASNTPHDPD